MKQGEGLRIQVVRSGMVGPMKLHLYLGLKSVDMPCGHLG